MMLDCLNINVKKRLDEHFMFVINWCALLCNDFLWSPSIYYQYITSGVLHNGVPSTSCKMKFSRKANFKKKSHISGIDCTHHYKGLWLWKWFLKLEKHSNICILMLFMLFDFIQFIKPKGSDIHIIQQCYTWRKNNARCRLLFLYIVTYLKSALLMIHRILTDVSSICQIGVFFILTYHHTIKIIIICTVFLKKFCVKESEKIYCHNLFVLIKYFLKLIRI